MSHAHDHAPAPANLNMAFGLGIALNLIFIGIEFFYGWQINSLALLADASHNLSDVAGLVLAWLGVFASRRRPDARHTYGWRRGTILAAFANALILLMAVGGLMWEAVERLNAPNPDVVSDGVTMMVVAGIGIVINAGTAMLFMRGRESDLNIRGAFLHMSADALVSAGVVLSGALTLWMGWSWLDPMVSLLIGLVILLSTWGLFKESLHLMFDGVPERLDPVAVRTCLEHLPGVTKVSDLHIWAIDTTQVALTAHLIVPNGASHDALLKLATEQLHDVFEITHVTLQVMQSQLGDGCDGE
jgi:cobalt-zinc-cadmium efflux system protein